MIGDLVSEQVPALVPIDAKKSGQASDIKQALSGRQPTMYSFYIPSSLFFLISY